MWQVLLGAATMSPTQTDPDVPEPLCTACGAQCFRQSLSNPRAAVYGEATLIPRQESRNACSPLLLIYMLNDNIADTLNYLEYIIRIHFTSSTLFFLNVADRKFKRVG